VLVDVNTNLFITQVSESQDMKLFKQVELSLLIEVKLSRKLIGHEVRGLRKQQTKIFERWQTKIS